MKCPKCKKEIEENSKFCNFCGEKINKEKKKAKIENESKIDDKENDNIDLLNKLLEIWKKFDLFEKISISFGGVIIILLLIALITNKSLAVFINLVQLIGIVVIFLIQKNIIKTNKNWIKYLILVVCFFMLGFYINVFKSRTSEKASPIVWNELVLGEIIPEIKNHKGIINLNSDERLDIYINNVSSKEFYSYIESCKNKGFNIDEIKKEYEYEAYTNSGYKINIYYYEYSKELYINLSKPEKFEEIEWFTSDFAKLLPTPKSNFGKIIENSEKVYLVKLSNMSIDDFNEYILQCKEQGFSIDVSKTDRKFVAKNENNNKLEIEYKGNNLITIKIEESIYEVQLKINFIKNWIFSKYDVELYVDDNYESKLSHGENGKFSLKLYKGKHKIKFVNSEDSDVKGYIDLEINKNQDVELEINCYSSEISVQNKSAKVDASNEEKNEEEKETIENTTTVKPKEKTSYSTNDRETAKNGNTGVYSYKKVNRDYDIYVIVDFDENYVYYFLDGNGSETCDKVKITSGDLNSVLLITYHDGNSVWNEGMHFKYKNQPDHLIYEDGNHFEWDYYATNLDNALKIRDKKKIINF